MSLPLGFTTGGKAEIESKQANIGRFYESQSLGLRRLAVGKVKHRLVRDDYSIPELEIHVYPGIV